MKGLIVLAGIVVALVVVGVIHFQKGGNTITISIDEKKLEETTEKAVQKGEEVLHDVESDLQKSEQDSSKPDLQSVDGPEARQPIFSQPSR